MNVQIVRLQTALQEAIRRDIRQLFQCVDLRQFVFDGELILGINVRHKLAHRRFGRELDRFDHSGVFPFEKFVEARLGVFAQPCLEWGYASFVLGEQHKTEEYQSKYIVADYAAIPYPCGKAFIAQRVQQVHGLAIAVATNDDVPDIVDDTAQLEGGRFAAKVVVLEMARIGDHVARVSH